MDLPELEKRLLGGGSGENGYDYTKLIGVEVLPEPVQVRGEYKPVEPDIKFDGSGFAAGVPLDYNYATGAWTILNQPDPFAGKVAENSGDSVEYKLFKGEELR